MQNILICGLRIDKERATHYEPSFFIFLQSYFFYEGHPLTGCQHFNFFRQLFSVVVRSDSCIQHVKMQATDFTPVDDCPGQYFTQELTVLYLSIPGEYLNQS